MLHAWHFTSPHGARFLTLRSSHTPPPPPPSPQHYYTMEQIFLILSWSPGIFSVLLSSQVDSFHHCDAGRWNERWRLWPRAMSLLMLQNTAT